MRIYKHKKKGMTLIEAIISVALLSILIIPISGLVMTSVNTNKKAEIKQEAAFVGQKLLEEMKVYDKITLDASGKFQLLNGQEVKNLNNDVVNINFDELKGQFKVDKYDVEIKLIKDNQFTYDDISNIDPLEGIEFGYELELKGDISKKIIFKSNEYGLIDNSLKLEITNEYFALYNNGIADDEIFKVINTSDKDNILIELNDSFTGDIKLDVYNQTGVEKNIYIKKSSSTIGNVQINSFIGKIKILNNIISSNKNTLGDLYNVEVIVSNRGNTLFKGTVSQNIWIK